MLMIHAHAIDAGVRHDRSVELLTGLSWWDAMILNSAIKTGAGILWSEDFTHGQRFGDLLVRNPFA